MYFHLLTVEDATEFETNYLRILPQVTIQSLIERAPNVYMAMRGDKLELRLPDGRVLPALVGGFGMEGENGNFYTTSDPANPILTLCITGDITIEDVPPGTEVWLSEAKYITPPSQGT